MVTLTEEERLYLRDVVRSLNPREDTPGAMLSRTDAVRRFGQDRVGSFVVKLSRKLDGDD